MALFKYSFRESLLKLNNKKTGVIMKMGGSSVIQKKTKKMTMKILNMNGEMTIKRFQEK